MNVKFPGDDDNPLQVVLKEWKVNRPLSPNFQNEVWRRIQRTETQRVDSNSFVRALINWISTVLPQPALAVGYLAALLVVGASFGWAQSQQRTARVSNDLSLRYVRSIDPYQTSR